MKVFTYIMALIFWCIITIPFLLFPHVFGIIGSFLFYQLVLYTFDVYKRGPQAAAEAELADAVGDAGLSLERRIQLAEFIEALIMEEGDERDEAGK